MPPTEPVDLIEFVTSVLAILAGPAVATLLGSYTGIFLAACAGAALSLSGSNQTVPPFRAIVYVFVRILVGCVLTVPVAKGLQVYLPSWGTNVLVILVAFGIGSIRNFEAIRNWLVGKVKRFFNPKFSDSKRRRDDIDP